MAASAPLSPTHLDAQRYLEMSGGSGLAYPEAEFVGLPVDDYDSEEEDEARDVRGDIRAAGVFAMESSPSGARRRSPGRERRNAAKKTSATKGEDEDGFDSIFASTQASRPRKHWLLLIVVVLAGIVLGVIFLVQRFKSTGSSSSSYSLSVSYTGEGFFDGFTFFTGTDPTNGYVNYLSRSAASTAGLITATSDAVTIRSAASNSTTVGRSSVRLQSQSTFNKGLFIAQIQHFPTGCGTWPALWLVGDNWPNQGEIDIAEGFNQRSYVWSGLHTSAHCNISSEASSLYTGSLSSTGCYVYTPGQPYNYGCYIAGATGSMGSTFNAAGGGVYATEWTDEHIAMWFWPMASAPSDVLSSKSSPSTSSWGTPYAYFALGSNCSPNHFKDLRLIVDLTFCGDSSTLFSIECPNKGSCASYVESNPTELSEAYWVFQQINVYTK